MDNLAIGNLFSVRGKVALVTGGSRGIGLGISRGLVENGCTVYITARSKKDVEATAAALNATGPGKCIPIAMNCASEAKCKELAAVVAEHEGGDASKLHILVNNAGTNWGETLEKYPDEAWDKLFALNLKTIFSLTRECLPMMERAASAEDPARVINIGSIDGVQIPSLETYAYTTSKAAVHQLTRVMAPRLAPRHITVNAIAAGPFESKMMAHVLKHNRDLVEESVPLKRIGTAADLSGMVLFLSSRAGAWVTGTVIPLDGGSLVRIQSMM